MITISSKRACVRIISYALFSVAALITLISINAYKANYYKRQVELANQRSLIELSDYIDNIELELSKSLYSGTNAKLQQTASSLRRESACAKNTLSEMPLSEVQMEKTYKFLSQVGDYALFLSGKAENGEEITEEEYNNLVALSEFAAALSEQISSITGYLNDGNMSFDDATHALSNVNDIETLGLNFSDAMQDTEQTVTDYPTLIYDGPFSDHMAQLSPKMTANENEISPNQALQIAADFLGIDKNKLASTGDTQGNMPCYNFSDSDKINISVTKLGGFVVYTLNSRYAGEATVSVEEATQKALDFLAVRGITNMVQSYYAISDGIATINFAYQTDNVICYPDLIKVCVALDNGDILSFDAINYLMNHSERQLSAPKITKEQAAQSVSKYLSVQSVRLAVIPTDSANEKFCYEFTCKSSAGSDVLVYINCENGCEEEILLMLYTDNGVFTK